MSSLNLIRLFDFYLMAMFLLSTVRRLGQYRAIGALLISAGRWPRLLEEMKKHRAMFITWTTLRPAALAMSLWLAHMVLARAVWPHAHLTPAELLRHWYVLPVVLASLAIMLGVDVYFLVRVGRIDRKETEEYLDKAEYWLKSWKAPVVRILTFGYINPRRMVSEEVQKAMTQLSDLMNNNFRWMALQLALRVLFGVTLWMTWALWVRGRG